MRSGGVAVIDTSPLFALFDHRDQYHQDAVRFLQLTKKELWTSWAVVTEVVYLLNANPYLQSGFLKWVLDGAIIVEDLTPDDLARVIEVMQKYADLPADFADATLVALADRLGVLEIVSFDSDFDIYRRADGAAFIRLPT